MLSPTQINQEILKARFSGQMDSVAEDFHILSKKIKAMADMIHDTDGNPMIRIQKEEAELLRGEFNAMKGDIDTLYSLKEPSRHPAELPVL